LREEMPMSTAKAHDEEEKRLREQLTAKMGRRIAREERAVDVERAYREERKKTLSVRLAEVASDARACNLDV